MAYTTIKKPSDYFNTKLYTGNGSTQSITGVGFQPDFTWLKSRSNANVHALFDAVRGVTKRISSNDNTAEYTEAGALTAFDSDGFSLGNWTSTNGNGHTLASWNWKANGAGSANTDGTISSTVSVNATSGFSIVSYTGTGSNATVGTGLGSAPKMILFKNRPQAEGWIVYHQAISNTHFLTLNSNGTAVDNATMFNDTSPTSSVFSVGSNHGTNGPSHAMIAYCFAEVKGFSKFGSYTGNGSADGTFVYTGFKPSFVMVKRTDTGDNWLIKDIKRDPINQMEKRIFPNLSNAEDTGAGGNYDFLSNGFKLRESDAIGNASGGTYIYMAFAEQPLVGDNPATAR